MRKEQAFLRQMAALGVAPPLDGAGDEAPAQDEFAWLKALPVPAAVFIPHNGGLLRLASNRPFEEIDLPAEEDGKRGMKRLGERIDLMRQNETERHFASWRTPSAPFSRQFDVSIARLGGEGGSRYLVTLVDRTLQMQGQMDYEREIKRDSLTALPNRMGFEELIEEAAGRQPEERSQSHRGYALIALDLSRFHRINECVGPVVGDELIITVARRLKSALRAHDILARTGGDVFALFAYVKDRNEVCDIAARLERCFAEPYRLSDLEIQIDCAIGAATGTIARDDPQDALRHSYIALKRAKKTRNFQLYRPEVHAIARKRFTMETDLRKALQRDELRLHFQPVVHLGSGKVAGFEALTRWESPDRGRVSPAEFISVAEESGLIVPLGQWVMQEAACTLARWDARHGERIPLTFSVNVSPAHMERDDVGKTFSEALGAAGVTGDRFALEITESSIISNPEGAIELMRRLKSCGAMLAMDDFGTGYSNLAYLQRLPLDILKIDRSFITGMLEDGEKAAIVRTVLSLADALGMRTTAEGVETPALSDALSVLGCTFGQGYHYARPMPADDAYEFFRAPSFGDSA